MPRPATDFRSRLKLISFIQKKSSENVSITKKIEHRLSAQVIGERRLKRRRRRRS